MYLIYFHGQPLPELVSTNTKKYTVNFYSYRLLGKQLAGDIKMDMAYIKLCKT